MIKVDAGSELIDAIQPLCRGLCGLVRISAIDTLGTILTVSPPHALTVIESGDRLELVFAADCGPLIERSLKKPATEPLSQAALEVLSIVAYAQPITRADISYTRTTDSSGVVETVLARGLIADDPRFGRRGRPSFLVTTDEFFPRPWPVIARRPAASTCLSVA